MGKYPYDVELVEELVGRDTRQDGSDPRFTGWKGTGNAKDGIAAQWISNDPHIVVCLNLPCECSEEQKTSSVRKGLAELKSKIAFERSIQLYTEGNNLFDKANKLCDEADNLFADADKMSTDQDKMCDESDALRDEMNRLYEKADECQEDGDKYVEEGNSISSKIRPLDAVVIELGKKGRALSARGVELGAEARAINVNASKLHSESRNLWLEGMKEWTRALV